MRDPKMTARDDAKRALEQYRNTKDDNVLDIMILMAETLATGMIGLVMVIGLMGLVVWKIF